MAVYLIGWPSALRSRLCPIGPSASLRADEQPSLPSGQPAKGGRRSGNASYIEGEEAAPERTASLWDFRRQKAAIRQRGMAGFSCQYIGNCRFKS